MQQLGGNIYYRLYSNDRNNKKLFGNYSTPSISVGGKSAAWHLEVIISALPRIRVRDSLPKIWPVTSPSCNPLHLAKHAASCFTWPTAPEWRPPSVSIAKGRKTRPWRRQASAVSLVFLWQALEREAPGSLAASATLEGQRGPVTVTSIATSFPFAQRRIVTSPGRAMVPGKRCFSSLLGPKSALAAVSNKTSLIILCLAIRSEVVRQPREWSPMRSLGEEQAGQRPAEECWKDKFLVLDLWSYDSGQTFRTERGATKNW